MGELASILRNKNREEGKHCSLLAACEVVDETATIYWQGGVPIVVVCKNGYLLNTDREMTETQRLAMNQILPARLRISSDWTVFVPPLGQSVPYSDGLFIPSPHLA